jgi:hypothetical protein
MTTSPAEPVSNAATDPAAPARAETETATETDGGPETQVEAKTGAGADAKAERTTDIVAGPGGVMTDEVGVVTGDLTIRTEVSGDRVQVRVQYKDAEEWYRVSGARAPLADPADAEAVHRIVTGILHRPEG